MKRKIGASLLAMLFSNAALAQQALVPKEFYFDEDAATTRPIVALKGQDDATVARLMRMIERGDRDADKAIGQVAHIAFAGGRVETGNALYAQLIERSRSTGRYASALWNYGWDLYRAGDLEGALREWTELVGGRVSNPAWAPPTLALVLWKLDRKDEAVRWYAAAVRTEPDRWRSAADFPTLLPEWTQADRATLAEVLAAWQAKPPAWP